MYINQNIRWIERRKRKIGNYIADISLKKEYSELSMNKLCKKYKINKTTLSNNYGHFLYQNEGKKIFHLTEEQKNNMRKIHKLFNSIYFNNKKEVELYDNFIKYLFYTIN